MTIGERIVQRRNALGMSQEQLADALGIHPKRIAGYEQGRNNPGSEVMAKLTSVLGVSAGWLFDLTDKLPSDAAKRAVAILDRLTSEQQDLALRLLEQFL